MQNKKIFFIFIVFISFKVILNQECYQTCKTCSAEGDPTNQNCQSCKDSYYFIESSLSCKKCYEGCKECTDSNYSSCTSCLEGYYLLEKQCLKCYDSCSSCTSRGNITDHKCSTCLEGYYKPDGGSNNCYPANYPGYYLDTEKNKLKNCTSPCQECSGEGTSSCLSCVVKFEYNTETQSCSKCPEGSSTIITRDRSCIGDYLGCKKWVTTCTTESIDNFECSYDYPVYYYSNKSCSIPVFIMEKEKSNDYIILSSEFIKRRITSFIYFVGAEENSYMRISYVRNYEGDIVFIADTLSNTMKRYLFGMKKNGRGFYYENNEFAYQKILNLLAQKSSGFQRTENLIIEINGENYIFSICNAQADLIDLKGNHISFNTFAALTGSETSNSYRSVLMKVKDPVDGSEKMLYGFANSSNKLIFIFYSFSGTNLKNNDNYNIEKINTNIETAEKTLMVSCFQTDSGILACLILNKSKKFNVYLFDVNLNILKEIMIDPRAYTYSYTKEYFSVALKLKGEIGVFIYNAKYLQINKIVKTEDDYQLENYMPLAIKEYIDLELDENYVTFTDALILSETEFVYGSSPRTLKRTFENYIVLCTLYNNDLYLRRRTFLLPTQYHSPFFYFDKYYRFFEIQGNLGLAYGVDSDQKNSGVFLFNYCNSTDVTINNILENKDFVFECKENVKMENNIFAYEIVGIKILSVPPESSGLFPVSKLNGVKLISGDILDLEDGIVFAFSTQSLLSGTYTIEYAGISQEPSYEESTKCLESDIYYGNESPEGFYKQKRFLGKTSFLNVTVPGESSSTCDETQCNSCTELDKSSCITCPENLYPEEGMSGCYDSPQNTDSYFDEERKMFMRCNPACGTCSEGGKFENNSRSFVIDSNCISCASSDLFLIGDTKNCSNDSGINGYNLNKEVGGYIPCPDHCKTCSPNPSDPSELICERCEDGSFLYEELNLCFDCRDFQYFSPEEQKCTNDKSGYFETEEIFGYTSIILGKCHEFCLTCNQSPNKKTFVMNCITCKEGYYLLEDVKNCSTGNVPYYYLDNSGSPSIYRKCHTNCLSCNEGSVDDNDMKCLTCDNNNGFFNVYGTGNCIQLNSSSGYYLKENNLYQCETGCATCSEGKSSDDSNMNCDECDESNGYFLIENTKNCVKSPPDNYYLDDFNIPFSYKKCPEGCKGCRFNGTSGNVNCLSCDNSAGYYKVVLKGNCANVAPEGYGLNEELNIYEVCADNCLTCFGSSIEGEMKCNKCKYGFFKLKGTTNCIELEPGKYYDENTDSIELCFSSCETCSAGGDKTNTNCDICKENLYFIEGTKHCVDSASEKYILYTEQNGTKIFKHCHENCLSCFNSPVSDSEMNCNSCDNSKGYYFLEDSNNCFITPFDGYYIDYDLKRLYPCYESCKTCNSKASNISGELIMNCLSCDNSNNFYSLENTNNCLNKDSIPVGYYFDSSSELIKKCHNLCKACLGPSTNDNMNCQLCIDNYYLVDETNNCENTSPEGYYLNLKEQKYKKCYSKCQTCSGEGNEAEMNCLSCDTINYSYDEASKSCIANIKCDLGFYYDEDSVIHCLKDEEKCPNQLPYQITQTKQCIEKCSAVELFKGICNTNNPTEEAEKNTINNLRDLIGKGSVTELLGENSEETLITDGDSSYEILKSGYKSTNNDVSSIDLGECENILKTHYGITGDLLILKVDKKIEGNLKPNVQYEVYNPDNSEKLDLKLCEGVTIKLEVPVKINETELEKYDPNSAYYTDICASHSTSDGLDITLDDKGKEFNEKNLSLCEADCTLLGYDSETKKAQCECGVKTELVTDPDKLSLEMLGQSFVDLKDSLNLKILKCYKLLFSSNGIKKNIGSYVLLSIIFTHVILTGVFLVKEYKEINNTIQKIVEEQKYKRDLHKKKTGSKRKKERYSSKRKPSKKKKNSLVKNKDYKHNNIGNNNHKDKHTIPSSNQLDNRNRYNEPPKNQKGLSNKHNIKINFTNVNEVKDKLGKKTLKKNENNNKKQISIKTIENKIAQKGDFNYINGTSNNKLMISQKILKLKKNQTSFQDLIPSDQNQVVSSKKKKTTSYLIEEDKYNLDFNRPKNDYEVNLLSYKEAIIYDKRTFFQYYFSLLHQYQTLFFAVLKYIDYNARAIKISLFFFSFALYYTINGLFFTDEAMSKIYHDKGKFDFLYQIPQIIYSTIISTAINMVIRMLSLYGKDIVLIKREPNLNKIIDQSKKIVKCITIKLLGFYILSFLFLFFFWYYLGCFCAVYSNTQAYLIKDTLLSFGLSMLYPFGIYLIPPILRIPALRAKNKECFYKIANLIG